MEVENLTEMLHVRHTLQSGLPVFIRSINRK